MISHSTSLKYIKYIVVGDKNVNLFEDWNYLFDENIYFVEYAN